MKHTREPISKSVRFEVFARDGYTCRYCGRNPDEVKLVIDHVIPVSKGGTNDIGNLATSCEACNGGKGVKDAKPEGSDKERMARLQMLKEQEETAKATIKALKARQKFKQTIIDAWCTITGREHADAGTIGVITCYIEEFGMDVVIGWMEKAYVKCGSNDRQMGRYISGIRRKVMEEP